MFPRRARGRHRHSPTPVRPQRWGVAASVVGGVAVAAAVVGAAVVGTAADRGPLTIAATSSVSAPATPTTTLPPGAAGRLQDPAAATTTAERSTETVSRVQIPAIGVDAAVELIDRDAGGVLLPPTAWADAGWYRSGVLPGAIGPAVIAGHLDTTLREAVFAHLKQLVAGDRIIVTLSDGSRVTFAVDDAVDVEKKTFPTDRVYGPTPDAQLRLITCNWPYDDAAQSYANNYVVFASLVANG